jgi:F0F1-type ATP synthase assembly protein I
MEPKRTPSRAIGEGYKMVALGATFAGAIVLFTLGGWLLDGWLGWTPVLTLVGTVVGTVLGFAHVYLRLQEEKRGPPDRGDGA